MEFDRQKSELALADRSTFEARVQSYRDLLAAYAEPTEKDRLYWVRTHLRLASALHDLTEHEEALEVVQTAHNLAKSLKKPELMAAIFHLEGVIHASLGHRDMALASTEEAVKIRRELARKRPDAFLPDLAMSLGGKGTVLRDAEKFKQAAESFSEGIRCLKDLFFAHPKAFSGLMDNLIREYTSTVEASTIESNRDMEALIASTREKLNAREK